jgi:hypothetical protein
MSTVSTAAKKVEVKTPVKVAPKVDRKVEVKVERKASIQTQKNEKLATPSDRSFPVVLLAKPSVGMLAKRQVLNIIQVGDTVEPHHVRSIRVAVVDGRAFGTNHSPKGTVGSVPLNKALVFGYNWHPIAGRTARTAQPWDEGNERVIKALEKLGLITKYELEFHIQETQRLKKIALQSAAAKDAAAKHKSDVSALTALAKKVAKEQGLSVARGAVRKAHPQLV